MDWHDADLAYTEVRAMEATLGGRALRLVTRPGFPGWDEIGQAEELLAAHAAIGAGHRALVFGCGHGALGVWAAERTDPARIALRDTNAIAVEMARRTCAENGLAAIDVQAALPAHENADIALVPLPKGRDLADRKSVV